MSNGFCGDVFGVLVSSPPLWLTPLSSADLNSQKFQILHTNSQTLVIPVVAAFEVYSSGRLNIDLELDA